MIQLTVEGADKAATAFAMAERRALSLTPVLAALGRHMKTTSIPDNFAQGGRPEKWPASHRPAFGPETSDPLVDTGELMRGIGYKVEAGDLFVGAGDGGSKLRKAALLQYGSAGLPGGVVKPKNSKWLAIPILGPGALTKSEARTMRARDFHGAFVLMKGPEGPGIYRKSTSSSSLLHGRRGGHGKSGGQKAKSVVRIFAFVDSVTIPARPYLLFQNEDVEKFLAMTTAYLADEPNWAAAR